MYAYYEPNQLWYIVMNSFVHSLMYTYYALRVKPEIDLLENDDDEKLCSVSFAGYENSSS